MTRVTVDGKIYQFSTKQSILPENWNVKAGKATGKSSVQINKLLEDIKASLNQITTNSNGGTTTLPLKRLRMSSWVIQRIIQHYWTC
jgi:Arm DNA-binding domain